MHPTITLEVASPPGVEGPIQGFRFLWAFYVRGYDPRFHCQRCFRGRRVPEFSTRTAAAERPILFDRVDRYPFLYVCGDGVGPKRKLGEQNLHFPLRHAPGAVAEITSYNGYVFRARDAAEVAIPEPLAVCDGMSDEHVRCKNFRFAVGQFGYPPEPRGGRRTVPLG